MTNLAEKNLEMPEVVKSKMEQSMGYDFSKVKMRESEEANQLGANAYAKGNIITFAPGKFNPMSVKGQKLIGHELGHIVQNSKHSISADINVGEEKINLSNNYEAEADSLGEKAANYDTTDQTGTRGDLQVADAGGSQVVQGSFFGDLWQGIKGSGSSLWTDTKGIAVGGGNGLKGVKDNNLFKLGLNGFGIYSGIQNAISGFKKDDAGNRDWLKGISGLVSAGSGLLGGIMNLRDIKNSGTKGA